MFELLKDIIANEWVQRIATLMGGIAVVIGFFSFLFQDFDIFKWFENNIDYQVLIPVGILIIGLVGILIIGIVYFVRFFLFHRRYNKQVFFEHRDFNTCGLRIQRALALKLEDVFIELRVAYSNNPQGLENFNLIFPKNLDDNRPIWDFLHLNQKHHKNNTLVFAIIGVPGCGKSMLLQHIAVTVINKRYYRLSAYTPILLLLQKHAQTIVKQAPNLANLVQKHFSNTNEYPNLNPPAGWFSQHLTKGNCLILLDGLDEIAELEQRQTVSRWINAQIPNYPHCRFVITSRPRGYLEAPIERANVLEVQPFNTKQVQSFVRHWYLANTISDRNKDEGVHKKARENADDLLQRLQNNPTLNELTINPLLLTMMTIVHSYQGELPERRVKLYAEICDGLFEHWRRARGIQDDSLTADQKRVVLQPLAAEMMKRKLRNIHMDEVIPIIQEPLQRVGLGVDIRNFLKDMQASSGLLLEDEVNIWRFAHLTFQEYLAAVYFLEQKTELDWDTIINDSWWHETLRLYVAQGDATQLAQACLDDNTVKTLTLAVDFLEEARELEDAVRRQIKARLISDLESNDLQHRQLAAEVYLSQRLKKHQNSKKSLHHIELQRIDEHRQIDLYYITCAEYQLFLDEKHTQNKLSQNKQYYQPAHWTAYTFPKGTAQEPVRGIDIEDAKAFCEWLTQKQSGETVYYKYRLPQGAEVNYPTLATDAYLATWYQENEGYSLNGLTQKEEADIRSWSATVSNLPFDLYHIYTIDRTSTNNLARILYRYVRDHTDNFVLMAIFTNNSVFNRVNAINIAKEFAQDLNIAFTRDLNIKSNTQHVNDLIIVLAKNFNKTIEIEEAMRRNDLQAVEQIAQTMQNQSNLSFKQAGTLIGKLIVCASATTPLEVRQAWRKYIAVIAEYILMSHNEIERPWWQRLFQQKSDHKKEDGQVILNLYWWLQIIIAQEEGKLPAYEGIRIVRERQEL